MKRRDFIATGLAAGAAAANPALAQTAQKMWTFPEEWLPRIVRISGVAPGEVHVVPSSFDLYWTLPEGKAIRYKVGIGRPGLYESGVFYVGAKKEWPSWTPTDEMIEREPEHYAQYADGMPGGPGNPLGARALYLFKPGIGDTFLRIHGTFEPQTIGRRVSNGCARLANPHIEHLYAQVPMKTRVVLHPTI